MNFKEYLQKQAENDAEAFLSEADKEFCRQLAEKVVESKTNEKPKKKRKKEISD